MNKEKILGVLVIFLLLSNAIIISYVLFADSGPPAHKGPKAIIIKRLQFNDAQVAEYEQSIKEHRQAIEQNERQLLASKNHLYALLSSTDSASTAEKEQLYAQIAQTKLEIEKIHFQHFEQIRSICTNDQMDAFEDLTSDLSKLFLPHHPKHKKR